MLEHRDVIQQLFHIHNHSDTVIRMKPRSIEQLAMVLAVIRPGKKHLILGNHDNPKFLAPFFKSIKLWSELPGMVLSHAPLHEQTLNESHRFKDGILNVHGHIHTNACPPGPYKCVSVEQINFTPLDVEELGVG